MEGNLITDAEPFIEKSTLALLESFVGGLKQRFPFLYNFPLIPLSCHDTTLDIFQNGERFVAYEWSDDSMYYLGRNIAEVNRNYEIVKMKGWECSVFPPLDPITGEFIKQPGRYFGNRLEGLVIKTIHNVTARFTDGDTMVKLIEALESIMAKHNELAPTRRFNLFALHTWIDRETPNVEELVTQEFYNRIAFGVCISHDHCHIGDGSLEHLSHQIIEVLYNENSKK